MSVQDIIINYLKENEYDGLRYGNDCVCMLDDVCPCGELSLNCEPFKNNFYEDITNLYVWGCHESC